MVDAAVISVSAGLYLAIFIGLLLVLGGQIKAYARKAVMWRRLEFRKRQMSPPSPLEKHLNSLLIATTGGRIQAMAFLRICGLIFFLVCLSALQSLPTGAALVSAAITAIFPYMALRVKLEGIRKKSSFEGEEIISSFLSNYRISNFNIYMALEQTALKKQKGSCGPLLYHLLIAVRGTTDKRLVEEAAARFSFAVNTNWSRMLAYNIVLGAKTGINVSPAIEDILIQLREARAIAEERKRLNSEASRMVLVFIPLLYGATVFMSLRYVGITPGRLIHNQLFTAEGFVMLLASVFLFFANLIFIQVVNNQKFDY